MVIKTITCHEVYNYGASLQEYALLYYLNSIGHQAEAIHYKPPYLSKHFKLNAVSNPKYNKPFIKQLYLLAKLPVRLKGLKRKKAFDRFSIKYIPTANKKYSSNEDLKNDVPNADAFICGSDQIWNSFFANGKDPAFYLDFVPDNKLKIAYAASFAIDQLDDKIKSFVKEKVSRLDAVGVRETSGLKILSDLDVNNAVQVMDPVFLLGKEHWMQFITPINEDFVFVYDFDSNPIVKEIALNLKKEKGWRIYAMNQNIKYADKNYWKEGPEKFLSLVAQSKLNLTNSFHSTAFSLVFEKQFVVVNRSEDINTRMRDLMNLFDLRNLVCDFNESKIIKEIDYNEISVKVTNKCLNSKKYLIEILNG